MLTTSTVNSFENNSLKPRLDVFLFEALSCFSILSHLNIKGKNNYTAHGATTFTVEDLSNYGDTYPYSSFLIKKTNQATSNI
jgi:hypothetical protein